MRRVFKDVLTIGEVSSLLGVMESRLKDAIKRGWVASIEPRQRDRRGLRLEPKDVEWIASQPWLMSWLNRKRRGRVPFTERPGYILPFEAAIKAGVDYQVLLYHLKRGTVPVRVEVEERAGGGRRFLIRVEDVDGIREYFEFREKGLVSAYSLSRQTNVPYPTLIKLIKSGHIVPDWTEGRRKTRFFFRPDRVAEVVRRVGRKQVGQGGGEANAE